MPGTEEGGSVTLEPLVHLHGEAESIVQEAQAGHHVASADGAV